MISLIGPMGAGKSTIGRRLADALPLPFVDLDAAIVQRAGKSIPRIFSDDGECVFRALEGECLQRQLDATIPCVLATGGGIVLRAPNRHRLQRGGPVIWLDASPETLAKRIAGDRNRPLLRGVDPLQKARELDQQRRKLYESCAQLHISTEHSNMHQTLATILEFLEHENI